MLAKRSKTVYKGRVAVAEYGIMGLNGRWSYMKNCRCAYYDRWHSEWVCSRYDAPIRVCCPCGRPDIEGGRCEVELELFQ